MKKEDRQKKSHKRGQGEVEKKRRKRRKMKIEEIEEKEMKDGWD